MLTVKYPWQSRLVLTVRNYVWQRPFRVRYPWGLLLRAGKTGKHAGTQKRHAGGSTGGQGGRFAKKQIAKELPGPVQDTMKAFQAMNGARSKLNKKKRQLKKAKATNDPFLRAQLPAEIKKLESNYAKAKTNFKSVQNKAKEQGYQVNALGKWSNKGKKGVGEKVTAPKPEPKKKKPADKKLTAIMKPKPEAKKKPTAKKPESKPEVAKEKEKDTSVVLASEARKKIKEIHKKTSSELAKSKKRLNEITKEMKSINQKKKDIQKEAKESGFKSPFASNWSKDLQDKYKPIKDRDTELFFERKAIGKERASLNKQAKEEVFDVIKVKNPAKVSIDDGGVSSSKEKRAVEKGMKSFSELVDNSLLEPDSSLKFRTGGTRASYRNSTKSVQMNKSTGEGVVAHEAGHWLEYSNSGVHEKTVEFYKRRTQGQPLERLDGKGLAPSPSKIREKYFIKKVLGKEKKSSGYGEHEVTRPDDFLSKYMGKDQSMLTKDGKMNSSEIISMGIEEMIRDPHNLATKDPDYFDFMYNTLRGN